MVNKGYCLVWYEGVKVVDLFEFNFFLNVVMVSIVVNVWKMKGILYLMEVIKLFLFDVFIYFLFIGRNMDLLEVLKILENSFYKDWVYFFGFCWDVLEIVKVCDFSILFFIFGEVMLKGVLEVMFIGNFMIIIFIVGNWGMVIDGEIGLVVFFCDLVVLVKVIEKFVFDVELRVDMGKKG